MSVLTIHSADSHFDWDRSLEPVHRLAPGDTVALDVLDASGGQIRPTSTAADLARLDFSRINPVTGPIAIDGARPGDVLVVEIVDFDLSGWGWSAILPGFGLLADDFPEPYLRLVTYDDERVEIVPGVTVPTRPFPGTIGVAPAAAGPHSVIPPRNVGGNMDFRDLVRGARVHLPVEVDDALLSIGDTHAAQGHGEVCGTAIESPMKIRIRVELLRGVSLRRPQFVLPPGSVVSDDARGHHVTTGISPDLHEAARDAIRDMIGHMRVEYGISEELAYVVCSVAVNLVVSEVVNAPSWMVAAYLPRSVFS